MGTLEKTNDKLFGGINAIQEIKSAGVIDLVDWLAGLMCVCVCVCLYQ